MDGITGLLKSVLYVMILFVLIVGMAIGGWIQSSIESVHEKLYGPYAYDRNMSRTVQREAAEYLNSKWADLPAGYTVADVVVYPEQRVQCPTIDDIGYYGRVIMEPHQVRRAVVLCAGLTELTSIKVYNALTVKEYE